MASEPPPYPQSTLVLCKHTDNLYYEAKVIKVTKNKIGEWIYRLHYTGWNVRYDENIKHSDTPSRFMAYTPDNIEMTKQQKHSAIALSKGAAKRKRRTYEDEGTSSVQSSNVSTAEQPTKFTKPPIPSRIIFMLQNVRNVPNLEEKTSVDEFLKKVSFRLKVLKLKSTVDNDYE
uniref:MRG domain-containing protein n=1 Tax=Panagrolaimus superbus TaxID=310955 RepID=A0A914YPI6_9BILA